MFFKKRFQTAMIFIIIFSLIALPATVYAGSTTCGGYVIVVKGDTLRKIAERCDTTVSALVRANNLANANLIYVGQVLTMPGALLNDGQGYDIYIVNHGDTLKSIAGLFSTSVDILLGLNPEITNANLIFAGQRLKVPEPGTVPPPPPVTPPPADSGQTYYVKKGDTLRKIADKFGTTVNAILRLNTGITNPNLIYVGQAIKIPAGTTSYVVQKGDTLRIIASRFGTTVDALLKLNPEITNRNLIFVGQVIKIR